MLTIGYRYAKHDYSPLFYSSTPLLDRMACKAFDKGLSEGC